MAEQNAGVIPVFEALLNKTKMCPEVKLLLLEKMVPNVPWTHIQFVYTYGLTGHIQCI